MSHTAINELCDDILSKIPKEFDNLKYKNKHSNHNYLANF